MDKSIRDKLLSCNSYDQARPILETVSAGVAVHKLFTTGYHVQAKQPTVARDFFNTAIREIEDEEEKKIKEADGGKSTGSSSTTGLEKVGTETDAAESFHTQPDKKDQMGVPIGETFPGQAPPPGMAGGQAPPPPQQMAGGCGGAGMPPQQAPPMAPQQQMQYTITEIARQFAPQFTQMREALKALDKKINETMKTQPNSLELGSGMMGTQKSVAQIRETTGSPKVDLTKARQDITKLNDFLNTQR